MSIWFLANADGEPSRHDGRQMTWGANVGIPLGPNGFLNVTGEVRDRNRTNRAGYDLRPNYNRPTAAFDAREITFDRLQFRFGDPDTEDYNLFVNAGADIGGSFELYAFGSYGHRDTVSAANWRQQNAAANRDFSTLAPNVTPNAANFVPLTPDGFLPLIVSDLDDFAATVGLKWDTAGWQTDLSYGRGQNDFDYQVRQTLNTSYGPGSQHDFDAAHRLIPRVRCARLATMATLG